MKVLFSNPPWWLEQFTINDNGASHDMCLAGIRAGSRWPHTIHTHSTPDNFIFGGYLPYPFFMGYATTYAARATGADVVMRDSLALRESYATYFNHLREANYRYIFIEFSLAKLGA